MPTAFLRIVEGAENPNNPVGVMARFFGSPVQGVSCPRRAASRGVFLRRLNTDDFASETEKHPQPTGD